MREKQGSIISLCGPFDNHPSGMQMMNRIQSVERHNSQLEKIVKRDKPSTEIIV